LISVTAASNSKLAHIPDISTQEGLLDVIMLGNLLEFSKAFAGKSKANSESEEQDVARFRYRRFMAWFADHHLIATDSLLVNPFYIFYRSLIEFGSSLSAYKSVWSESNPRGQSAALFQRHILEHVENQWPRLVPRFQQLLDSPTRLFTWSGPTFTIWRRDRLPPNFAALESMDLPHSPVFSVQTITPTEPAAPTPDASAGSPKSSQHVDGEVPENSEAIDPLDAMDISPDEGNGGGDGEPAAPQLQPGESQFSYLFIFVIQCTVLSRSTEGQAPPPPPTPPMIAMEWTISHGLYCTDNIA
jgi:hypothetical protein